MLYSFAKVSLWESDFELVNPSGMMTGKYVKEDTKCIYQKAENIRKRFLLVTIKMRDKFIVIQTSQLSAFVHILVT